MSLNSHQGDKYIQSSVVLKHSLTREEVIALSKVDSLTSNLSVSAPLSPLVAFAITLANLNINPWFCKIFIWKSLDYDVCFRIIDEEDVRFL